MSWPEPGPCLYRFDTSTRYLFDSKRSQQACLLRQFCTGTNTASMPVPQQSLCACSFWICCVVYNTPASAPAYLEQAEVSKLGYHIAGSTAGQQYVIQLAAAATMRHTERETGDRKDPQVSRCSTLRFLSCHWLAEAGHTTRPAPGLLWRTRDKMHEPFATTSTDTLVGHLKQARGCTATAWIPAYVMHDR